MCALMLTCWTLLQCIQKVFPRSTFCHVATSKVDWINISCQNSTYNMWHNKKLKYNTCIASSFHWWSVAAIWSSVRCLQTDWSPPVVSSVGWPWFRKALTKVELFGRFDSFESLNKLLWQPFKPAPHHTSKAYQLLQPCCRRESFWKSFLPLI